MGRERVRRACCKGFRHGSGGGQDASTVGKPLHAIKRSHIGEVRAPILPTTLKWEGRGLI